MACFSISTWSLHRQLGRAWYDATPDGFVNFKGETKYDDLATVLPRADSIHAKADYEDGKMIQDAFTRCLDLAKDAMFDGPYTLIFQDPGDEWVYLDGLKKEIAPYFTRQ